MSNPSSIEKKTFLDQYFKISHRHSKIGREILGGIATFFALSYILPVNAQMLGGIDEMTTGSVFAATALASALATFMMGIIANVPVALSAGMGMNAMLAGTICGVLGYSAKEALAMVMIAGFIFFILSLTGLRQKMINAIPKSLKIAITCGLGAFIAFVGLKNAGIIVQNEDTLVSLVNLKEHPEVLLALFGVILTFCFMAGKNKHISRFAVMISLLITAALGFTLHLVGVANMPSFDFSGNGTNISEIVKTIGLGFRGMKDVLIKPEAYAVIFSILFVNLFDTTATILAVGKDAGLVNPHTGEVENGKKAFLADSVGTIAGGVLGTSTISAFAESTIGVECGARTGLSSIIVSLLFILSLFLFPVFTIFTGSAGSLITASALISVGALIFANLKDIDWQDRIVVISTFLMILFMILCYSIADGIGVGFICYTCMMIFSKRKKEIQPLMYGITGFYIINYLIRFLILS